MLLTINHANLAIQDLHFIKMEKQISKKNKPSCKCCSAFCEKITNIVNDAKAKYNKTDKDGKKKIILGIGGIAVLFSGIAKLVKRKK